MVRRRRIIYRKSSFGHRESFGGHRYCTGTTGRIPGVHWVGLPIPEAPWDEVGGEPAPGGLVRPPPLPPLCLGLETLGVGAPPPGLGGKFPPWPPPPLEIGSPRVGAP